MAEWKKLEDERPVLHVIVSHYDEETGRYNQPLVAMLKQVWVDASGREIYTHDNDRWMPLPRPPASEPMPDPEF